MERSLKRLYVATTKGAYEMKLVSYFSIAIAIMLSGCAATMGNKFDGSEIHKIKTGTSTKENVLSLMGTPFRKNTSADGTSTWIYTFYANKVGLLAIYGMGTSESNSQTLSVTFNKSDVVTTCKYSTQNSSGSGVTGAMGASGEHNEMNCGDVH
jgi:outer membrane protein assembly factor BamE (lipoprotein component of BamABCDE complex)